MMGALADLGRKLEDVVTNTETGLGTIIKQWTEETIELIKQEAPKASGQLANSYEPRYDFSQEGKLIVSFIAENYAQFINYGVQGTENRTTQKPNPEGRVYQFQNDYAVSSSFLNSLSDSGGRGWIASKGIMAEDGNYQSLAWAIARGIKKKGINADGFLERVFSDERLEDLANRMTNFIQNKINE